MGLAAHLHRQQPIFTVGKRTRTVGLLLEAAREKKLKYPLAHS